MADPPKPKRADWPAVSRPDEPRPATAADIPAVAAIERDVFSDPWSARSLADALARPETVFLALDGEDGRVAGYAIGRAVRNEGEVLNLAVRAEARRHGGGGHLLSALLGGLKRRGARRVFLEVRSSNEAAVRLYEAAGFRRIGRRPAYYAHPREDAVTMTLDFGGVPATE